MCIIVHKPAGATVPVKTLKTCWENNQDGAGFMFVKGQVIVGTKGYMTFKELLKGLDHHGFIQGNQVAGRAVTIHFRHATHGGVTKGNCHPFPITDDDTMLKSLEWVHTAGVAHNGVIRRLPIRKGWSDSQEFVRQVLAQPAIINNITDQAVADLIAMATAGSRLFIQLPNKYILTGDWVEENGVLYSNLGYQAPKWCKEQKQFWWVKD